VAFRTTLAGFTTATFSASVQTAYRRAVATKAGVAVGAVVLKNIVAARRRLAAALRAAVVRRWLAASSISFDVEIETASTSQAASVATSIQAWTPAATKSAFTSALQAASLVVPADLSVAATAATVLDFATPTPAPTSANASPFPLAAIVGAVAAVAAIAAVALRRSKMSKRAAVSGKSVTSPATGNIEMTGPVVLETSDLTTSGEVHAAAL
jgi:hypothetical protein